MSEKTDVREEMIKGLVKQYKENLRTLYREGKLTHQQLEEQLCYVVDSVNEEIRKITTEVLTEEDGVKKTARVHAVKKKQRSTKKRRK